MTLNGTCLFSPPTNSAIAGITNQLWIEEGTIGVDITTTIGYHAHVEVYYLQEGVAQVIK